MDLHVDLGQILIAALLGCISIIGWYIKRDLTVFGARLDKHEDRLLHISENLQQVIGQVGILTKFLDTWVREDWSKSK